MLPGFVRTENNATYIPHFIVFTYAIDASFMTLLYFTFGNFGRCCLTAFGFNRFLTRLFFSFQLTLPFRFTRLTLSLIASGFFLQLTFVLFLPFPFGLESITFI